MPSSSFPVKVVWRPEPPFKVTFFVWAAVLHKIPTLDSLQLQRRGFQFPNRCELCRRNSESTDHILVHCDMAYKVWCFFIESFQFSWTCPCTTGDLLQSWHGLKFSKEGRKLWSLIPHAVFWMLWKTHNELIFRSTLSNQSAGRSGNESESGSVGAAD
ncbi:Reverse transcriptase zinc-binding domain [Macleaya cordata]|uniref:Reverse transcriptase zinc-binding domain n=1 Tax=Macleaya cordata TaxID=56857 RepID=A0A200QTX0_MACCD|nr:Reverse transcriptase zinc-binding domain [Macleaya cordata]